MSENCLTFYTLLCLPYSLSCLSSSVGSRVQPYLSAVVESMTDRSKVESWYKQHGFNHSLK